MSCRCESSVRVCVSCCAVCCGLRASAVVWAPAIPGSPRVVWVGGAVGGVCARAAGPWAVGAGCPRGAGVGVPFPFDKIPSHRRTPIAYTEHAPTRAHRHAQRITHTPRHATTRPAEPHDRGSDITTGHARATVTAHVLTGWLPSTRGAQSQSPQRDTSLQSGARPLDHDAVHRRVCFTPSVSHRLFHTVLRPARPSGGRVDGAACWHRERIADRCMRDALLSPAPTHPPPSAWPYRPLYLSTCFMVRSIIASASAYTETHSSSHTAASAALSPLAPTIF